MNFRSQKFNFFHKLFLLKFYIQTYSQPIRSMSEVIAAFSKRVCNTEILTSDFNAPAMRGDDEERYWNCCQIQQCSFNDNTKWLSIESVQCVWNSVGETWLLTWIWVVRWRRVGENGEGELTRCDKESERNGPLPWDQKRKVNDDVGGPWFYATRI